MGYNMKIIYEDMVQGSDEWHQAHCGILSASNIRKIMNPSLSPARNEEARAHLYELAAERITGFVEPTFTTYAMERGKRDEEVARQLYHEHVHPVRQVGFITNDRDGVLIGYSPDGLVGERGAIEIKSRMQKHQLKTLTLGDVPPEFILQLQTGLFVAELDWIDFLSYCGGMHMAIIRVYPDPKIIDALREAVAEAEEAVCAIVKRHSAQIDAHPLWMETERLEEFGMEVSDE
jgi:hypothetical protein